jgi:hypothetical protein
MKKINKVFLQFVVMSGVFFCLDVHAQKDMKISAYAILFQHIQAFNRTRRN